MNKLLAVDTFDIKKIKVPGTGNGAIDVNNTNLTISNIISSLLPYIFGAAGFALLIYLIIGGFQMMLSRGDPKAMQAAQAKITNAAVGFVIVFLAYFIVQLIGQIFHIQTTPFGLIFGSRTPVH